MRKLRDALLLIILITCVIVGATKYLLWYYTDQMARNIKSTLPPGSFSYDGITTSLSGKSSIDNIVLSTHGTIIYIKKLSLESNNVADFLFIIAKNWNKKLPNELSVTFDEIKFDSAYFFKDDIVETQYFSGCQMTKDDFLAMGYENIIINAKLHYKKTSDDKLNLDYHIDMKNMLTVSGSFFGDFSIAAYETQANTIVSNLPSFEISISNNKLLKNINQFCAKKVKLPLTDYLKQLTIEKTKNTVDIITTRLFDFVLDDQIIEALNQYEKSPELFDLSLKPISTIMVKQLKMMPEVNAINIIQPTLNINGKHIPVAFKWMTTSEMIESKRPKPEYKQPIIEAAERMRTPINELNEKAFNKKIEVRLTSGRTYKGTFTKVQGNRLYMMILNDAGTSDLALDINSIQIVYILSDYE